MWSFIQAAGWPVYPLLLTSIAALGFIIERALATRAERVYSDELLQDVLKTATRTRAATEISVLAETSLLGLVLAAGLSSRHRDRAHLKEAFEAAGHKAAAVLEKNLSLLAMIATVAPLMGLLGTVVGMIEVFGSQSNLGSDPQALAHGISVALYNTAFGLVIAIPAAIAHRYFRIQADESLQKLEDAARALLDVLVVYPSRPVGPGAAAATAARPGTPQASPAGAVQRTLPPTAARPSDPGTLR